MENEEEKRENEEETIEIKPDTEGDVALGSEKDKTEINTRTEDVSTERAPGDKPAEGERFDEATGPVLKKVVKNKKIGPLPALIFILLLLVLNGVFVMSAVDYLLQHKYQNGAIQNVQPIQVVDEQSQVIDVAKSASVSVVSIIATAEVPKYETTYRDLFNFQIPSQVQNGTQEQQIGAGSGFIVSNDGYIITNKHVVEQADAKYTVILKNAQNVDEKIEATVIARDPNNDIAILKIDRTDLPFLNLGDSGNLNVGQTTVAIGYALGQFDNTVSRGIISGLSRFILAGGMESGVEDLENLIQTDAAVNPGNSGGPLLDIQGNVIGVNVAMADAQSIGFAIPINEIKPAYEEAKSSGTIKKEVKTFLGVRYVNIDSSIQKANNLPYDYGVIVGRGENVTDLAVVPGSPADKAGIVENDIILEVDGVKIDSGNNTLSKLIEKHKAGDTVKLKIYNKGQEKEVSVTLSESQ